MDAMVLEGRIGHGNTQTRLEIRMKVTNTGLDLYRSLYWANQGLLHAVRSLQEAEAPVLSAPPSELLKFNLHRAQTMIEETRAAMNAILGEWVEGRQ